jgi:hypothetical protein
MVAIAASTAPTTETALQPLARTVQPIRSLGVTPHLVLAPVNSQVQRPVGAVLELDRREHQHGIAGALQIVNHEFARAVNVMLGVADPVFDIDHFAVSVVAIAHPGTRSFNI